MSKTPENTEKSEKPAGRAGEAKSTLRKVSLKVAGVLYSIGDISMAVAGYLKGTSARKEAATGAIWFAGGVAAAAFGNEKAERKLRRLRREISGFLRDQGAEIPSHSVLSTKAIEKETKPWDHVGDFLYKHPSQMLNASYAVGSVSLFKSAHEQKLLSNYVSAVAVEAGALGGLLIPEYKTPPAKKPEGIVGKTWHWMREKPLRFSGIMYWINNGAALGRALEDRKKWADPAKNIRVHGDKARWAHKSYIFTFITLANYVVANLLLLLTPKEEVNKKQPLDISSLEKAMAEVIAAQPPLLQEDMIHQLSGFLATRPEINGKASEIANRLTPLVAAASRPASQGPEAAAHSTKSTSWREKTSLTPTPATGLSL